METRVVGSYRFILDFSQPIYEQLVQQFRQMLAKGEIELGSKLPSVRDFAVQMKINPSTVVRAYQELERDGLCEKRRGQGTFITSSADQVAGLRREMAENALESFVEVLKILGVTQEEAQKMIAGVEWK
ncbi:GntR family transcriptional regulator [Croceifilum oryzae]|uniref:GntR family transcriptional regulator n=1 Tax=Croceifilum oryzae TaxID=1553429 RepID=A0AAJ1WTN1_9BACL|nr:GntR family transcriptional regulator [Croceifilum oryzae]MDQ0418213.1 GntR family transcriptional regulator [Croceifilum oryzae]